MKTKQKTILFTGGGTAGPVSPLIAILQSLKTGHPNYSYHWVGTKSGPERKMVASEHIAFSSVPVAKLHRFFTLKNIFMPFMFIAALFSARRVLKKVQPDIIVGAGAFVSVPVVWMGSFMGIPSIIHQLDIRAGLANKLMAPFAKAITVTFEKSLQDFSKKKTVWTGAPVRDAIADVKTDSIKLKKDLPTVLVFGGGTGAEAINTLIKNASEVLLNEVQVIHLTGKGKMIDLVHEHYHGYEFLGDEMAEAYAKSDLVVGRAGLATFTELARLKKAAMIIPMPGTHQEENAMMLHDANAAVILNQGISPQEFAVSVLKLVKDKEKQRELSENIARFYIPDATEKIVEKMSEILYDKGSEKID